MSPIFLVVVAPLALALCLWALLDLERFVLIVVLGSMFFPGDIAQPGGANVSAIDVFTLLALGSWLINSAVRNAPDPLGKGKPIILAGIIFAVLQWVTLIWSSSPHRTLIVSIHAVELFIAYPLLFASLPTRISHVRRALELVLALSVVLAAATLIAYASSHQARVLGPSLPALNKNSIGCYLAAGTVIAYALLIRRSGPRVLLVVVLLLDALGLFASLSRGAMLGTAAGVLVVSLMMIRGKIAAVTVLLIIAAAYFAVVAPAETVKTKNAGSYSSADARLVIWRNAVHIIEQHPILGVGSGAYWDPKTSQTDPSNTFLRTWAETGILGMIALGWLLAAFFRSLPRWRRVGDPSVAALAAACAGIFVSQLVHSQVDVSWTRGIDSLMFAGLGLLIALDRLALPSEAAERLALPSEATESAPSIPAQAPFVPAA